MPNYLLKVDRENMKFWEMSTHLKIKESTLNEQMPICEKLNIIKTNMYIYIQKIHKTYTLYIDSADPA